MKIELRENHSSSEKEESPSVVARNSRSIQSLHIENLIEKTLKNFEHSFQFSQIGTLERAPADNHHHTMVKCSHHAMTWYDQGDLYSPWYDDDKIMAWLS